MDYVEMCLSELPEEVKLRAVHHMRLDICVSSGVQVFQLEG